MAKRGEQKKQKKKAKRTGIVPRTVFAVAVSIGSVPAVEACGSAHAEYGVAAPSVAAISGGESPGTDGGITEVRFGEDAGIDAGTPVQYGVAIQPGVAAYETVAVQAVAIRPPPPPPAVAALPHGVAVRPDYYGVAAPRH